MTTSRGILARTSRRLAKHHRPSTLGITKLIKKFNVGDSVIIVHKGISKDKPHPRYRGRTGVVVEKRGASYVVLLKKMSKTKTVKIIAPQRYLEKSL